MRGLSTYGNDNAKWSVFDFGPLHRQFKTALEKRQIHFLPVLGMGVGSLPEVAARAIANIEAHPEWDNDEPVHILGHSAGGLAARLVLQALEQKRPGKIASCLTVATPHAGSRLSEILFDMPTTHRGSHLLLRSFGYNVTIKRGFFNELRRETVAGLFKDQTFRASTASVVCSEPRTDWCVPLKMFQVVKAFRDFDVPSDGIVERDSQPFGNVVAELNIDHFRQVGLFGKTQKFEQMCDVIAAYFKRRHN